MNLFEGKKPLVTDDSSFDGLPTILMPLLQEYKGINDLHGKRHCYHLRRSVCIFYFINYQSGEKSVYVLHAMQHGATSYTH